MRLILTGFGAFQGVSHNPTEQLIAFVEQQGADLLPGVDVELRTLRVAASAADAFAAELAFRGSAATPTPLLIVHLGVDSRPDRLPTIALERCATNECGFPVPDEDGLVLGRERACCGVGGGVVGGGGDGDGGDSGGGGCCKTPTPPVGARLSTGLDLCALRLGLERRRDARTGGRRPSGAEYGVAVSEDAGRFLCNYVYARSLHACARLREGRPVAEAEASGGRREEGGDGGEGARGGGGGGRRLVADALFVHVPPFAVLPERAQREALVDLLRELAAAVTTQQQGPTGEAGEAGEAGES